MVTHHPKVGYQPSEIKQKEVYYRLVICHIDLIMKLRPGDNCHGWSATIPWMGIHHPKDKVGHLSALDWSPIIKKTTFPNIVAQLHKDGYP